MDGYGEFTDAGTVRFERLLPGPVERVWAYLIEPAKRATWLADGPIEPWSSGAVALRFRNSELSPDAAPPPEKYRHAAGEVSLRGRVTRCEPPRLLAFTWGEGPAASEVLFELSPGDGGGTCLVLTHRRLDRDATALQVSSGWHAHLGVLRERLEGAVPRPFWPAFAELEAEYARRLPAPAA